MVTDEFCHTRLHLTIMASTCQGGGDLRKRRWQERLRGGDYFKYFCLREAIIRGGRLIEGRVLFEEIRYALFVLF